ncbi:MAG: HRDC domain-containing protein [Myxococcota bacterium]|nr:HRDC domain-containing protein [Myxococcota bacterium]
MDGKFWDLSGALAGVAEFELITEMSDLKILAKDLEKADVIAFDTEADSFYHYFDKTCLLQISTRDQAWLVDPLALGGPAELAPLGPIFANPKIRILFHAAEYDIFILKRDCGFTFTNLFDTMLSAQLLGYPSVGLAALVERHFGIHLPKDEQKSDWSRRPLTEKQLEYAVTDVYYLIRLAEKLELELKEKERLDWAHHEFENLVSREWPEREFDKLGYLKIKGAKLLDPTSLAVLRELYLTRDARAREIDRPPFKVLGNRTLLELAKEGTTKPSELVRIKGVTELILRRMGDSLREAIARGLEKPHGPIPKQSHANARRRMDRQMEKRLARLKAWREKRSKELELDPGVLAPNACLEAVSIEKPSSIDSLSEITEIKKWFAESFGEEILAVLDSEDTDNKDGEEVKPRKRSASAKKRRRRKSSRSKASPETSESDGTPAKE